MPAAKRRPRDTVVVALLVVLVGLLAPLPVRAARETFKIEPGPTTMTDEEKALQPDPARGAEHGVILVEEVDRNDNLGRWTEIAYHRRAKILSNEGRRLGNITIPHDIPLGQLSQWWARVLLPDGQVLELRKDELVRQTVAKKRGDEITELKGALPGVVPGAVIDYGYVLRTSDFLEPDTLWLQREWPTQQLRYRWTPWMRLAAGCVGHRIGNLDVKPSAKDGKLYVEARELAPVRDEPMMPPEFETKASLVFYYYPWRDKSVDYWDTVAKGMQLENEEFLSKGAVTDLLARAALPEGEAVTPKLRAVYEWIGTNIENMALRTIEAEELAARTKQRKEQDTARYVMEQRRADGFQIAQLFVGAARELGAEAWIALAPDRTENYFNKDLPSLRQVPWTLVALRAPDGPANQFQFVAPGSGLPYGEIPWWLAGVRVPVFTKAEALPVLMPTSEARDNLGTTRATVSFSPDGSAANLAWSTEGKGQYGYSTWRALRRMKPDERDKRMLDVCGAGGEIEIGDAVAEGLSENVVSYRIRCAGELITTNLDEQIDRYTFAIDGPWIRPLPDLPPGTRHFPVVTEYPLTERTTIEVAAPPGFVPGAAPAPIRLTTSYGSYTLTATRSDSGFVVERELVVPWLTVAPESYFGLVAFIDQVRRGDATVVPFLRSRAAD